MIVEEVLFLVVPTDAAGYLGPNLCRSKITAEHISTYVPSLAMLIACLAPRFNLLGGWR
jgi:hypothetical protein